MCSKALCFHSLIDYRSKIRPRIGADVSSFYLQHAALIMYPLLNCLSRSHVEPLPCHFLGLMTVLMQSSITSLLMKCSKCRILQQCIFGSLMNKILHNCKLLPLINVSTFIPFLDCGFFVNRIIKYNTLFKRLVTGYFV